MSDPVTGLYPWDDRIDPATIPDEVLRSQRGIRNNALRKHYGGGRPRREPQERARQLAPATYDPSLHDQGEL
jgi:hypothetical protein